ncbi:MAG: hypothetical protein NC082_04420 [Clostridiales bacterium]|nr:hypothetical protein [Clostridiales bacterium]
MRRIISHIEYLLDHHECVIVPGLGAFIGHRRPAVIDTERNIIMPPHRVISFNGDLTHDDGLLCSSYSRSMAVPYTVALQEMQEDVRMLNSYLMQAGELRVGEIGSLRLGADGMSTFTPASSSLYNSYGLSGIDSSYIKPQATDNHIDNRAVILEKPRRFTNNGLHGFMRYAAMLAVLIGLGIVLSTPVAVYEHEVTKASMMPIETTVSYDEDPAYMPCELLISKPYCQSTCLKSEPETVDTTGANYCLVIASLATLEQATEFIDHNRDYVKGMFESNGRYRVYALIGATIADVTDADLQSRYEGAWPCRMPQ